MAPFLVPLAVFGILFAVWTVFVLATVASLKNLEVHTSSWHYRIHGLCVDFDLAHSLPKGRCRYAWAIILGAPIVTALCGIIIILITLVICGRFLWHWVCEPLILGKRPIYPMISEKHWEIVVDPDRSMPTRKITSRPPYLYWLPALGLFGIVAEIYRVASGWAGVIESYCIVGGFSGALVLIIIIALFHRVSAWTLWITAMEKLCPNLDIVYDKE